MHDPEEQQSTEGVQNEQHSINVRAAYRVLVRAFYRLECNDNTKEKDHDQETIHRKT